MAERLCPNCNYPLAPKDKAICKPCRSEEAIGWGDDYDMSPAEEAAAERAYENSRARAEWDHYHPGEPCPDIELPHPKKPPA